MNAEGEDVANPQGAIDISPLAAAAPNSSLYTPRPAPLALSKTPDALLPPAPVGKTAYAPLPPQRVQPLPQSLPPDDPSAIDISQFDLPAL